MPQGEAVIKIDADTAAFIQKMVDASERAKKGAKGVGDEWEKTSETMSKAVMRVAAIVGSVATLNKLLSDISERSKEIGERNREAGAQSLNATGIASRLGVSNVKGFAESISATTGGTATGKEVTAFAGKLAEIQDERAKNFAPRMSEKDIAQLINVFRNGGATTFGESGQNIADALKDPRYMFQRPDIVSGAAAARGAGLVYNGQRAEDIIKYQQARMPGQARQEIEMRMEEARFEQDKLNVGADFNGDIEALKTLRVNKFKERNPLLQKIIPDWFLRGREESGIYSDAGIPKYYNDPLGRPEFFSTQERRSMYLEKKQGEYAELLVATQRLANAMEKNVKPVSPLNLNAHKDQ